MARYLSEAWTEHFCARLERRKLDEQAEICRAIVTFARDGSGDVAFEGSEDRPLARITTENFLVFARIDLIEETILALDFTKK